MAVDILPKESYLYLQAPGIDMQRCHLDYSLISVGCEDLTLYKKAFRVKIRALIKEKKFQEMKRYVNTFYTLAHFTRYLYGFHSCSSRVELWQEKLARRLKLSFNPDNVLTYDSHHWIEYKSRSAYHERFMQKYRETFSEQKVDLNGFIQDEKPFLNPKDKTHFDTCMQEQERV